MTNIRHRTRRRESEIGVTTEMICEVMPLVYEQYRDSDFPDYSEFLLKARKSPSLWYQYFDFEPDEDFSQFGENASKVRAVMRVAALVLAPPPASPAGGA